MRIYDKKKDEKLQHKINRKEANIPALSSGKIDELNILHTKKCYNRIKVE